MLKNGGPGSSVGIVTDYGLDSPGIESRWGEIFRRPDRPWGPPSLLYNGYRLFPGGKVRPARAADHPPLLVPGSWKSRAIPLPTLWATPRPVRGKLYLYLWRTHIYFKVTVIILIIIIIIIIIITNLTCIYDLYFCKHFGIPKMCTFSWWTLNMVQWLAWWWPCVSKHVATFIIDNKLVVFWLKFILSNLVHLPCRCKMHICSNLNVWKVAWKRFWCTCTPLEYCFRILASSVIV